jgi:rhodanese-related sulfurtransferase
MIQGLTMREPSLEIAPAELKAWLDAGAPLSLIDVREPREFAVCRIGDAELIPMRDIPGALPALREKAVRAPLVVYCHHGVRSRQVVAWLRRQGLAACRSLSGGLEAWRRTVDPSLERD